MVNKYYYLNYLQKFIYHTVIKRCFCAKSVQIRSFSGPPFPVFGQYFVMSPNTGKYRPEKIPYLDTFHAAITF